LFVQIGFAAIGDARVRDISGGAFGGKLAERLVDGGAERFGVDIADDGDEQAVARQVSFLEIAQVLRRDFFNAGDRAAAVLAVRMGLDRLCRL
jgi:hypothetical protein